MKLETVELAVVCYVGHVNICVAAAAAAAAADDDDDDDDGDDTGVTGLRVSYPHDSLLTIEYPFKMAVSFETIPHPLLSTERPLVIRRRVILPDNVTHTAEWRYYGYSDARTPAAAAAQNLALHSRPFESLRSRGAGSNRLRGYHGKELLVYGHSVSFIHSLYDSCTSNLTELHEDLEEFSLINEIVIFRYISESHF